MRRLGKAWRVGLTVGVVGAFLLCALALFGRPWSRTYDLVVYGATPQGVTMAAAAARAGLDVALIEESGSLGGVLTRGGLATLDNTLDDRNRPLSGGLFLPFFRALGYDPSFDVARAEAALTRMLRFSGARLRLNTRLRDVRHENGQVTALVLQSGARPFTVRARYFADATDTAQLAARAGARFTVGRADGGLDDAQMAATLVFRLRGVNWEALRGQLLTEAERPGGGAEAHGRTARGFWNVAQGYRPSDPARFFLRGLNLARQDDGSLLVNGLMLFGVDGTDPAAVRAAHADGAWEAARATAFLRAQLPTVFGQAVLAGVAPEVYLRESRHLVGLVRLRADDVLYGRRFSDGLALGGYPLDGQLYRPGEAFYSLGRPKPYEVPLRALIPAGFTNLLVVSQAASFDSAAAFSARVAPLQMALGQSAGLSVALARARRATLPDLAHSESARRRLRQLLVRRGVRLGTEQAVNPDAAHPAFGAARALLRRGLFGAPGDAPGELRLNDPISARAFLGSLQHLLAAGSGTARTATFAGLRARYGPHPLDTLTRGQARALLDEVGLQGALPRADREDDSAPLRRGEAAELLWSLTRARLTQR